jgi:RNA polymerase sigma factor (sigma-70 family)
MCTADQEVLDLCAEQERLARVVEQTGSQQLAQAVRGIDPLSGEPISEARDRADWVSTCLMDAYRRTGNREAMALLFEHHRAAFLRTVKRSLPVGQRSLDPEDVVQDVFAAVCRYPHNFNADRPAAYRNWAYRILRNRMFHSLRATRRAGVAADESAMLSLPDHHDAPPEQAAIHRESSPMVDQAYVLLLGVMQWCYEHLPARDRDLLQRVELDGCCYSRLAADLGVSVGVVKVRVFRCRQRVARRVDDALCALAAGGAVARSVAPPRRRSAV